MRCDRQTFQISLRLRRTRYASDPRLRGIARGRGQTLKEEKKIKPTDTIMIRLTVAEWNLIRRMRDKNDKN